MTQPVAPSATPSQKDLSLSLLNMSNPEVIADPASRYKLLREYDPVHWDPYTHAWVVTSYAEAVAVLMTYSADRTPAPDRLDELGLSFMKPFSEIMLQQMMFMDGSAHSRLRTICAAIFTPRKAEELRAHIESVANGLIDNVIASGHMDLIADFAAPLPAIVTSRLLGVPIEDHEQLHHWVLDIAEVLGNFQHHPNRVAEIVKSLEELKLYVANKIEQQRRRPTGGLILSLMTASANGQSLTDEEVVANTIITLIGGHETTMNLIASGMLTLINNPDSMNFFRAHPEIAPAAVEELLRFESPVQHTARIAPTDTKLGGKSIAKGARVVVVLAAANRDPERFPEPDRLDLLRTNNRHLAFGWAAHFCFGAPLARLEAQIAFNALLKRLNNIALSNPHLEWRGNAGLRGLTSLKIQFDAQPVHTSGLNGN